MEKNYNPQQIDDAINQAGIKETIDVSNTETIDAPSPGSFETISPNEPQEYNAPSFQTTPQPSSGRGGRELMETIQQITESIVNEKWEDLMGNLGNITLWKEKVQTDIRSIKQEIVRTEERLNNLQGAVIGKVGEFDKHMIDVTSEIKALEKVMEKIIEPLAENIRELNSVSQKLKERIKSK